MSEEEIQARRVGLCNLATAFFIATEGSGIGGGQTPPVGRSPCTCPNISGRSDAVHRRDSLRAEKICRTNV